MAYTSKVLPAALAGNPAEFVSSVTVLNTQGVSAVVGTPTVTVLRVDDSGNVFEAAGTTVPTSGDAGYSTGCVFVKTNGGAGTTWYLNEGTAASATFRAIDTAGGFSVPIAATDSSSTTTTVFSLTGTALTTGIAIKAAAVAATLTTGRYYSAYDGATEVFGIGTNGHIISTVSAVPPTCAITAAHGITAATITAGSTDTCGVITTTGTQDNATDSTFTITFGKTYTTAPKSVTLFAANAAGAVGSSLPYVSSISATAVVFGVSKSAAAAATPSWYYQVIA